MTDQSVICECGAEVEGDICFLCGRVLKKNTTESEIKVLEKNEIEEIEELENIDEKPNIIETESPQEPETNTETEPHLDTSISYHDNINQRDTKKTGNISKYILDISECIHIQDRLHNTIYKIPFEMATCSSWLYFLRIKHTHGTIRLKDSNSKSWLRAIHYMQKPILWYIYGVDDCEISYMGETLGITPCIIQPPFSWSAFDAGMYSIRVSKKKWRSKEMGYTC